MMLKAVQAQGPPAVVGAPMQPHEWDLPERNAIDVNSGGADSIALAAPMRSGLAEFLERSFCDLALNSTECHDFGNYQVCSNNDFAMGRLQQVGTARRIIHALLGLGQEPAR